MISSGKGLEILRKWNKDRTPLVLFSFDAGDMASRWDAFVADVNDFEILVETTAGTLSFDLNGATFDFAETPSAVPPDLELPTELLAVLRSFLFIRCEGRPATLFCERASIN